MEINIQANEHFIDYLNNWDKRFYYIVCKTEIICEVKAICK